MTDLAQKMTDLAAKDDRPGADLGAKMTNLAANR